MLKRFFKLSTCVAVAASAAFCVSAHADVLYSSTTGAQTSQFTFSAPGEDPTDFPTSDNPSYGDDYDTGYSSILLNGLSFFGGLQATAATDHLIIDFYDLSGNRWASVYPSDSEDHGVALHTLSSSDFNQNGVQSITLPGAGYVIFTPDTYTTFSIGPNGPVITPGDPKPISFTLAFGQLASVGVNDASLSATVDGSGNLTTAQFANTTLQCAQFELDGTGIGPKALQGDANGDGKVDLTDLNIVLNNLGTTTNLRSNGNFDGAPTIDLTDLNDVLNNLTTSLVNNSDASTRVDVPEPASFTLLATCSLFLIGRSRGNR
jgi:hypothetical protein